MTSGDRRPTRQLDSPGVPQLTKPTDHNKPLDEPAELCDWDDVSVVVTTPPEEAVPRGSRTATVDDPMTTGLLAEASRAEPTGELSPEQIEKAHRSMMNGPDERAAPSPRVIRRVMGKRPA